MIKTSELYLDYVVDAANKDENGDISYTKFNRMLEIVQLVMMDWLTGKFIDPNPPERVSKQKTDDALASFIKQEPAQVSNGIVIKPTDYYSFRSLHKIVGTPIECADEHEEDVLEINKKPIELLDTETYARRSTTWIRRLRPKFRPISKVGDEGSFEFLPKDIGSVILEYYRYPAKAEIVTKIDSTYNNEVPDETLTKNLEWPLMVKPWFIHYLNQAFALHTREVGFQQQNEGKQP